MILNQIASQARFAGGPIQEVGRSRMSITFIPAEPSAVSGETRSGPPAPRRLRVCHLSMTLNTGGLERLLVEFARFHDATRYDLSFLALGELGGPACDLQAAGYEVTNIDLPRRGKAGALRELRRYFTSRKVDILHTHNTYPHFYGALAARWGGVPTVINTQHGRGCGPGWKSLWQFRVANRLADCVVGVSEDAARLCQEQDRASRSRIQCIWNGIDVERFSFSGPASQPTAISVARLSPEKDFPTLLRAVRIVTHSHRQFRLQIVGDGAERPRLEQLARELEIQNHVVFLGERKDVPELLRSAGFFVSSSKTEGISLTLLEAMAVGLPIVTTRVGGNPEIVLEGVTGKLVPALNPDALAAGIVQMIDLQPQWPQMARAARQRVEENFNIRGMIRQYEELYQTCRTAYSHCHA